MVNDSLIDKLRSVKCTSVQTDLHRKWDDAIERCIDIVRQHEAQPEQEEKAFMKATQLEESAFEQKLQAIENPSDELLEVMARALYAREKMRADHTSDILSQAAGKEVRDEMEPWEECKISFIGDAKAALSALNNCGPLKSMGDAGNYTSVGTSAEVVKVPEATSPTTHTLIHLRNVLYILDCLHPDDQCDAYKEALSYYNKQCPEARIEPKEGFRTRLLTSAPLDIASSEISLNEPAAFLVAQTAYQQNGDGDVNPKALRAALSAYAEYAPKREINSQGILDGWRPIGTAPLDGSHIQLYRPVIQFVGYWTKRGWVANAPELPFLDGLTHWRPLQPNPEIEVQEDK